MIFGEVANQTGEALLELKRSAIREVRVALPGIVTEYNSETNTVSVQPAVMEMMDGSLVRLPILTDVPVYFPGGKGFALTFSISAGDECLIIFSDTSIDSWFNSSGVQVSNSVRRHSLSDGFALIGFRSKPNAAEHPDGALMAVSRKTETGWVTAFSVNSDGSVSAEIPEITDAEIDEITKE